MMSVRRITTYLFPIAAVLTSSISVVRAAEEKSGESVAAAEKMPGYARAHGRPTMGVHAHMAAQAYRGTLFQGQTSEDKLRNFGLAVEFMPGMNENMGVFSVGLTANLYPLTPPAALRPIRSYSYSVGGLLRYQLRFVANQILVPMGGAEIAYLRYEIPATGSGQMAVITPFAGLMFFLNRLDPNAAGGMYSTRGVLRSYLVGDVRLITGQNSHASQINGTAVTVGLRLEML